jgi:hypothetical protein
MKAKRIAVSSVGVIAASLGIAVMLSSYPLCACLPAGEWIAVELFVNPMRGDPEATRSAVLAKLPQGSPLSAVRDLLGSNYASHCRAVTSKSTILCTFDMAEDLFGRRDGYELEFDVGKAQTVDDVRVNVYKRRSSSSV